MPIVSAAEFSRLAGVSKVAVSKAPPTKIHKDDSGKVDTDHPLNAIYLAEHSGAKTKPTPPAKVSPRKTAKKPRTIIDTLPGELGGDRLRRLDRFARAKDQAEPEDDGLSADERRELTEAMGDDFGEDMAMWTLRDKRASALFKEAGERKITLAHQVKKGELLERRQFVVAVQGINKAIDDHLHRVPAKLGPVLFALARREGATELEIIRALETDMGAAIRSATEDVSRLVP